MAKRLARSVWVHDQKGTPVFFAAGSTPPDWAAEKITNPKAWGDEAPAAVPPTAVAPQDVPPTPEGPPADELEALDKDGLLAYADAEGIDVDRRLGDEKLRGEIRTALADR